MKTIYQLKKYDSLVIDGEKYYVQGFIELKQGTFRWKEFRLMPIHNRAIEYWLSVEKTAEDAILYTKTNPFMVAESVEHKGEMYSLLESGKGYVVEINNEDGISVGETVIFDDYRSDDGQRFLSCERWPDVDSYYEGRRYVLSAIGISEMNKGQEFTPEAMKEHDLEYWQSLETGQQLRIGKQDYLIAGIVKYKQDSFQWQEYKITGGSRELWLCVEATGNEQVDLTIFHNIPFHKVTVAGGSDKQIKYKNEIYDCIEEGRGHITYRDGDVDFDYQERFSFKEYQLKNKYISFEKWSDEEEYSYGESIQDQEITVLERKSKEVKNSHKNNKLIRWIFKAACILIALFLIVSFAKSYFRHPFYEALQKNRQFIYETSVTSNEDTRKKSHVFRTRFSPDEVCQILIKADPDNVEHIISSKDATDGERLILTNKETILIYLGEDNITHVQASARMDTTSNYNSYRARDTYRVRRFYSYGSRWSRGERNTKEHINTSRHNEALMKARQASVGARNSQGGGTGFGK